MLRREAEEAAWRRQMEMDRMRREKSEKARRELYAMYDRAGALEEYFGKLRKNSEGYRLHCCLHRHRRERERWAL